MIWLEGARATIISLLPEAQQFSKSDRKNLEWIFAIRLSAHKFFVH